MSDQLGLFDAPATRGASRRNGPETSRDAGRSVSGHVLRDQQALVLSAVRGGSTAYEAWHHLVGTTSYLLKENVVSKRLGELEDRGVLRRTDERRPGSTGRMQIVFVLTDAGRAYLADRSAA